MPVISRLVKILIVDDHGLVREGLQAILSRSELLAECVQAWDAASLWQQLEQHADIDMECAAELPLRGYFAFQSAPGQNVDSAQLVAIDEGFVVRASLDNGVCVETDVLVLAGVA